MSKPPCPLCEEPILPDEHLYDGTVNGLPTHSECMLRSVVGGIEHLTAPAGHALGSCYDGSNLSYRESSEQAAAWVAEHGIEAAFPPRGGEQSK